MLHQSTVILIGMLFLSGACVIPLQAVAADSQKHWISSEGRQREYLEYIPYSAVQTSQRKLVIVLHGGFGSDEQAEKSYGWDALAEREGFIVAYPNGVGRTWNAGACCGSAAKDNIDDLGFITAVIKDIVRNDKIDPEKVYVAGISNGGALAYRYACEGEFPIAAIGSVSGGLSSACSSPHALSVMEIHGQDDRHIPIAGGVGSKGYAKVDWQPLSHTLDAFKYASQCLAGNTQTTGVIETSISPCNAGNEIVLITIQGAGHQWPGGRKRGLVVEGLLGMDEPSTALNATSVLWEFFQRH